MVETLKILLLGGFGLSRQAEPLGIKLRKAEALVAYVACASRPVPRETLADLLWDDRTQTVAQSNLRVALNAAKAALGEALVVTRQTVTLAEGVWVDARQFETACQTAYPPLTPATAAALSAAMTLYRGDFLHGLAMPGARGFEEWLMLERERLRRLMEEALLALADFSQQTNNLRASLTWANRLLTLDPLRESAHQLKMRVLARQGQLNAALTHYDACRQILQAELGVEPAPATRALYERLLAASQRPPPPLPALTTPLVGRQAELARLRAHLADPACRLLTLTGPGGIGKTHLALQTAHDQRHTFINGVYWVTLTACTDPAALIPAIAEALHFTLTGKQPPADQLSAYLRGKEILLALDDFDHLLSAKHTLQTLLRAAPDLKLLVTSRERLGLPAEWLMEVGGLPTPAEAVTLFVHCARRVQPDFTLTPADEAAIHRIHQALHGLPLGLELAAAWVRTLSCADIAQELERGADFLASRPPGEPEASATLRLVFEKSWARLTAGEQTALARLCVLPAGFSRAGASAIAHADLPTLGALTDKSLVHRAEAGRFRIHEFLRQQGGAHLTADQRAATLAALADHCADWLGAQESRLHSAQQAVALDALGVELPNLLLAWDWATRQRALPILHAMLESLSTFYVVRGRHREGAALFEHTAAQLSAPAEAHLLGRLTGQQAQCCEFFAPPATTRALFEASRWWLEQAGPDHDQSAALRGLGYQALVAGDYDQAARLLEHALEHARRAHRPTRQAAVLNTLAQVRERQGRYAEARALCAEGLAIRRAVGSPLGVVNSLNALGLILTRQGAYAEAAAVLDEGLRVCEPLGYHMGWANLLTNRANAAHYLGDTPAAIHFTTQSLALCRDLGDDWGEAIALNNLGWLAAQHGDLTSARQQYTASLAVYQRAGIPTGQASTLANLGWLEAEHGAVESARQHLRAAVQQAGALNAMPVLLKALGGWARLWARLGQPERAHPVAHLVLTHPATEAEYRQRMRAMLGDAPAPLPPLTLETAVQWAQAG